LFRRLLGKYLPLAIHGLIKKQGFLSPPLKKGDLWGLQMLIKSPYPPFSKGGEKLLPIRPEEYFAADY
jgi:hypothetical protein